MPGWPVRVFISGAGSCYHATPYCPLLKGRPAEGGGARAHPHQDRSRGEDPAPTWEPNPDRSSDRELRCGFSSLPKRRQGIYAVATGT
jgi:hypothetical protein